MLRDVGENEDACKPNVLNSSLGANRSGGRSYWPLVS